MTKIYLFGSRDIYSTPKNVEEQLFGLLQQHGDSLEFIVGDSNGADEGFHKTLSAIGARKNSKVYCMDTPRNNPFELEIRAFKSVYDEGAKRVTITNEITGDEIVFNDVEDPEMVKFERDYYFFKERQMINECDMAIALWDTKNKGTFGNINSLKAQNKPVYVFNVVY